MTGFGAAEGMVGGRQLRVDLRTVKHRFFHPSFKLPSDLAPLEGELRDYLRRAFDRGHITVSMRWTGHAATGETLQMNPDRAKEAMARLRELQTAVGMTGEVPLDLLARQVDVLTVTTEPATPVTWPEIESLVEDAVGDCLAMRRREGEVLTAELRQRLQQIQELASKVESRAPARLIAERDRLRAAVAELIDDHAVDESRVAHEVALAADRLDITEELVRLKAHGAAIRTALAQDGPVGKQLGFLAQEVGREINTIGSKGNDTTISHWVVEMKGELEKFREQIENLE